ncbi:MAG: ribonuclease HII [Chlorobi bacterium]|nr:ribonuclease HII [Chlorobiota bacterium]
MKKFRLKTKFSSYRLEAGTDEAGRGALAGPVVAAAVILKPRFRHPLLNDSKQLTEKQRYLLRDIILDNALAWRVAFVSHTVIDRINILNASILAMHRALSRLPLRPRFILVDGNRFKPFGDVPYRTIVDGDARYMSIAAASVLAKTFRDDYMRAIHRRYPQYGWDSNKGYGTRAHLAAIEAFGLSPYHRRSFRPNIRQLTLDL